MADKDERGLTSGEIALLQSVYGSKITYAKVRVHNHRWFAPLSNTRAMAPNGNLYFPGTEYQPDFSKAPINWKATFIHEGAHLYQWYGLGQTVWARGPFDRNYDYDLVPGKKYEDYGLEQMGMIAQHYFQLLNGRPTGRSNTLAEYQAILPVR